jgi:tRNA(Ile)-lysidine synthase
MNIIEETLINNLEKFNLIGKKLVIGFSGGGDSTSLIIALNELRKKNSKLNFEAFHVNYGIRKESDDDQKFVENICNEMNINLIKKNLKDHKLIIDSDSEENLRNIRYDMISSHIIDTKSYCLITAHNLNDHVETFLMKLTRGAGLKGMEGLKYFSTIDKFNGLKIFRPFIEIKKKDLLDYCISKNINPVNDISNYDNKYSRNRIRNNVIPELEKLNPDFLNTINRVTYVAKEINSYQNKLIKDRYQKIKLIENQFEISFDRLKFNLLEDVEKKLIIKTKCESFSSQIFMEKKHLDIVIDKCLSKNNKFTLDMLGPIVLMANKDKVIIKNLVTE